MIRSRHMMGSRVQVRAAVWSWIVASVVLLSGCVSPYGSPVIDRSAGGSEPPAEARVGQAPAAPAAAAPAARPESYTVQKGDTLFSIAKRFGVPYRELGDWNGIEANGGVRVGQSLRLLPPESPVVAYAVKLDTPPEGKIVPDEPPPVPKAAGSEAPAGTTGPSGPATVPSGTATPPPGPATGAIGGTGPAPLPVTVADVPLKSEPKALKLPYSAAALSQLQKSAAGAPTALDTGVGKAQDASGPSAKPTDAAGSGPKAAGPVPPVKADAAPKTDAADGAAAQKDRKSDAADGGEHIEWIWPSGGRVASGFSEATKGIELSGAPGQAVVASASGLVTYVGRALRGYGTMVVIKHNKAFLSVYTNNSQVFVKEGQTVSRGQKIAEMGSSDGDAVALHFEIRRMGKPVDPMKYLPNDRS